MLETQRMMDLTMICQHCCPGVRGACNGVEMVKRNPTCVAARTTMTRAAALSAPRHADARDSLATSHVPVYVWQG